MRVVWVWLVVALELIPEHPGGNWGRMIIADVDVMTTVVGASSTVTKCPLLKGSIVVGESKQRLYNSGCSSTVVTGQQSCATAEVASIEELVVAVICMISVWLLVPLKRYRQS